MALDLAALNIQRGRDHGLPSYVHWREFCGRCGAVCLPAHLSRLCGLPPVQVYRQRTRWKTYPPRHASLHDNATYHRSLIALPTPHCHLSSTQVQAKLLEVYSNVADIDLWVGGLLERQDPGAQLGPTFNCIIAGQFRKIRDGDRCDHVPGLSLLASGPPSVSLTGSGSSGQASSPPTS